jgi:hypothetical protein
MLSRIVARRAAEVRLLLGRGAFSTSRVPLPNGGTLPAELFARVALDDLDYLTGRDHLDAAPWQRLAKDIELLHEVALTAGSPEGRA